MINAHINAIKKTIIAAKDTLFWMKPDVSKVNCFIDAKEHLEDAQEDLQMDGIEKGMPSAIHHMEKAIKSLEQAKSLAEKDDKSEANDPDQLIIAQCRAIIPMIHTLIDKSKNK